VRQPQQARPTQLLAPLQEHVQEPLPLPQPHLLQVPFYFSFLIFQKRLREAPPQRMDPLWLPWFVWPTAF
jgi:hypothetical protein